MDGRIFIERRLAVIGTSEGWRVWDFDRQAAASPWFDDADMARALMRNMSRKAVINDFEG